jgi:putative membrane protein
MCDMMGMMGPWMMILWLIIAVVVLGLGAAGAVWFARSLTSRSQHPELPSRPDRAQEELRRQYAAGNIDREEYLQRKIDLES